MLGPAVALPVRPSDADITALVSKARIGDVGAFEEIVRALQGRIRAFTRRTVGDPDLGDDAAQEAFLRVWRGLSAFRSGNFTAWCFRLAHDASIDLLRKQMKTPTPTEQQDIAGPPEDELALTRAEVRSAIDALGEPYRATFLMRQAGLTYAEIAEALGCRLGTVRSRLNHSRTILGQRLAHLISGGDP